MVEAGAFSPAAGRPGRCLRLLGRVGGGALDAAALVPVDFTPNSLLLIFLINLFMKISSVMLTKCGKKPLMKLKY
ncbi:MAG: hypothetical protein ABR497_01135 [Kiritimatiellia bacterium]